jgi:hypothetical protein
VFSNASTVQRNTTYYHLCIIVKHKAPSNSTSYCWNRLPTARRNGAVLSTEGHCWLRDKRHDRVGILSDKQTQQHETSTCLRITNAANDGCPITSNRHDYGRMRQQQVYVPAYPPSTCSYTRQHFSQPVKACRSFSRVCSLHLHYDTLHDQLQYAQQRSRALHLDYSLLRDPPVYNL